MKPKAFSQSMKRPHLAVFLTPFTSQVIAILLFYLIINITPATSATWLCCLLS
jgi:hypothetical protein